MRPSSQHWNVEPGTSVTKVKVAFVFSVISSGPERIVAWGGAVTVHSYRAGVVSKFPAASFARTRSTCAPRVRSENCWGETHELYAVPSSAHSNVRDDAGVRLSLPVNVNVATVFGSAGLRGPDVIDVFGGVVSGPSSTV